MLLDVNTWFFSAAWASNFCVPLVPSISIVDPVPRLLSPITYLPLLSVLSIKFLWFLWVHSGISLEKNQNGIIEKKGTIPIVTDDENLCSLCTGDWLPFFAPFRTSRAQRQNFLHLVWENCILNRMISYHIAVALSSHSSSLLAMKNILKDEYFLDQLNVRNWI